MSPANIAPTPLTQAVGTVDVIGQPRQAKGHPRTIWDQQDIDEYKQKLTTNEKLKASYERLKADMDKRIAQPLGVPDVIPGPPTPEMMKAHGANSNTIINLALVYSLSGDEKYGEYCRKMLLAYAQNYPRYQHPAGWTEKRYRSAQDGRLTGQFLDDGFWLIRVAFAYDLVHNLASWTPADHELIKNDLMNAIAAEFYHPVLGQPDYLSSEHNRSAVCAAGTLIAGYACDDDKLVNLALYGQGGTAEDPKGGTLGVHFTNKCILPDGMWLEGAPAYQLGITSSALSDTAETLWRNGIDVYRRDKGLFKRLLDSSIALAYPDEKMTVPALHDSAQLALLDDRNWVANENGVPYQIGYRRYGDPRYIPIVRNSQETLSMTVHSGPPSQFLDIPEDQKAPPRPIENANFYSVGYGVLRLPAKTSPVQVILEYGPSGSHGHPSKLGIDLFALEEPLIPFPGVIFPYNNPLDPAWYWTSVANCVVTVDEKNQITWGEKYKYPRGTPNPDARQLVFGTGETMGIERAWSDNLYQTTIVQDRSIFVTPNYLADLYGVFANGPHTYDLAWHFRGKMECDLPLEGFKFPEPVANGYNGLTDVKRAAVPADKAWTANITNVKGHPVRFFAPKNAADEVFTGKGHFFTKSSRNDEFPPTLIQRCTQKNEAIFANVVDISGQPDAYVKGVEQEGSLKDGYGLLTVQTTAGTDLCFTAFRAGTYKAAGLETDAQQAFVTRDGNSVRSAYLGGGTTLKADGVTITRSEAGLASVEKLDDGSYVVANASPSDASVTVTLPALAGLSGSTIEADGKAGSAVTAGKDGSFTAILKAGGKVKLGATR